MYKNTSLKNPSNKFDNSLVKKGKNKEQTIAIGIPECVKSTISVSYVFPLKALHDITPRVE